MANVRSVIETFRLLIHEETLADAMCGDVTAYLKLPPKEREFLDLLHKLKSNITVIVEDLRSAVVTAQVE